MSKLTILAAGAAGYVLGTRAGRERYEQIAATTRKVMGNPKVQAARQQAQDVITEQASAAGSVVADKAKATASAAADKVHRSDSGDEVGDGWPSGAHTRSTP